MTDHVLLRATSLSRHYGAFAALKSIDLSLARSEVLGFLGLNGAGKSTTMQILSGALPAHSGSVEICGLSLADDPLAAKRHIGYLPEVPPLYRDMLVDEFLTLCARLRCVEAANIEAAVARAKGRCGLDKVGARPIRNLSKGYGQRVGIAQAILHEPEVLILDEPTAGLDPLQIRDVRELIGELGRKHAVILSTHILPEAKTLASRIVILHQGGIVHDSANHANDALMRMRLRAGPPTSALLTVDAVADAELIEKGTYRVRVDDADDAATALCRAAVAGNWGMLELVADDALEYLFMRLTSSDAADGQQ